ncbi:MAG TPA: ribonuclease HI [Steroidobacteraceae bacterium]|nr:ribonuclease HI [Steroidobacteraceae bacterium]
MSDVEIYCDGACRGNPGPGGWGALLIAGDARRELSGYEAHTTNNRMELTAAIEALRALKRPVSVTVYTDSKYVITGIEEWLPNWKERAWRTADKKPVKNVDLWQALDAARLPHRVRWQWVRGHDGNVGNEHVDALANAAIDAMLAVTSAP